MKPWLVRCHRSIWECGIVLFILLSASIYFATVQARSLENTFIIAALKIAPIAGDLTASFEIKTGCKGNCRPSSPLVIKGGSGHVISEIRIDGASGNCVTIESDARAVVLENMELANCGQDGVNISGAQAVTIRNVKIRDVHGNAVGIQDSEDVTVTKSLFENVASGVYALSSSGVVVRNNYIRNVQGPEPRGQAVQFDKVWDSGNAVICNHIINEPGRSEAEDAINMFRSSGTSQSPILIAGNRILGGGPSLSGGGILVGDYGGKHIRVFQNRLVNPGQYGIAIAGGSHMELSANKVFAQSQPFTNVGLYVWKIDQEPERCHSHTVSLNEVNYTNAKGFSNPSWNAENCGLVKGFETLNRWNAPLDPTILRDPLPVCE